jgi:FkbM family methyltransferase
MPTGLKNWLRQALYRRSLWVSQAGQDFWVAGEVFNGKRGGFFLDIGAHDGVSISNTFILEKRLGWKGICVEGNPWTFELLVGKRSANCLNVCLDAQNGEVRFALGAEMGGIVGDSLDNASNTLYPTVVLPTRVLDEVLLEQNAPQVIDYLSIDVEGAEDRVLAGLDWSRVRFNCVTIERPSEALRTKFRAEGYVMIKDLPGLDVFYVHQDFMSEFQRNCYAFWNGSKVLNAKWR